MCRVAVLASLFLLPIAAQAETRAAHAHEHGASQLSIAIEGTSLALTLEAPGHDIVGFEMPPATDLEKAAMTAALAALADPTALFGIDTEANCALGAAKVTPIGYDSASADGHAEFHAEYSIACQTSPKGISTRFFNSFANAETLDVDILTTTGASEHSLTAQNTDIRFDAN